MVRIKRDNYGKVFILEIETMSYKIALVNIYGPRKQLRIPNCSFYNESVETYLHLFYYCSHIQSVLNTLQEWTK